MAIRYVNLSPREAYAKISEGLTGRFFSSTEITSHVPRLAGGTEVIVGIFEKYSRLNGKRVTLTVLCSPSGKEKSEVFFAASGASGALGLFDMGAADAFEGAVVASLREYLCREPGE